MNYGLIVSIGTQEIILCKEEDMEAKLEEMGNDPECLFDYFREMTMDQLQAYAELYIAKYPHYKIMNLNGGVTDDSSSSERIRLYEVRQENAG